jgi:peptidoglycan/xylan/chitin deacetylase (PgdA/CDA1 family)
MRHGIMSLVRLFNHVARRLMGTITHVATQDALVALTFDDGPHPESTLPLLDILEKHQSHATFFMIGEAVQRYPEVVQKAAQAGHAIGNHGWNHPAFSLIGRRERWAQIRACEKALTPYGQRLFRPPYGYQSVASRLDAFLLGYRVITWSVIAYDWLDHESEWMVREVKNKLGPGSIVLFHDVLYHTIEERYADREPMIKAVDTLLEQLGDRFRFVTVPELLRHGCPQRKNWYWEADSAWLNSLGGQGGKVRQYAYSGRSK